MFHVASPYLSARRWHTPGNKCHVSGWEFCLIFPPCPVKCLPARARPASPIGGRALQWQAGTAYLTGVKKSDKVFNL